MTETNDQEIEALGAAADRLYAIGRRHGWWPQGLPNSWRDLDPIGREEFIEVIADVVHAYVDTLSKQEK